MAEKTLNTVIVLRNDSSTDWASSSVVLKPGELGVSYIYEEDGKTVKNVMVKAGDGEHTFNELKQVESVLEDDITLTYNFGRHVTKNGSVDAGGKDMTMTEWLIDALSEVKNPTINYPNATLAAGTVTTDTGDKEIGSKITKFAWNGTSTYGSYTDGTANGTYGTVENTSNKGTGLGASNFTWSISNETDSQTGNTEDGTFELTTDKYIQINSESEATYAYINGTATINASGARTPLNNVGKPYEAGKIAGFDKDGTTVKTFTDVAVKATGFRKPFWGIKAAGSTLDTSNITSAQVRALPNKGTATVGLPTTTAEAPFVVAAGSQQVFFFAKAGSYSSLSATDAAAMNAGVTFTKVANAVNVEGANGYTATAYDMFFVDWGAGIDADKKLVLTWN